MLPNGVEQRAEESGCLEDKEHLANRQELASTSGRCHHPKPPPGIWFPPDTWQTLSRCFWNGSHNVSFLTVMEIRTTEILVTLSLFDYLTVQTMEPREVVFPQESLGRKGKSATSQRGGKMCPTKRFYTVPSLDRSPYRRV